MDKKELIFPGIILGIVLIVALGLILTHPSGSTGLPTPSTASSTASTTPNGTGSTRTPGAGANSGSAPSSYYPYGMVTLAIGEVAGFKDGLSIRPTNILEDSRCPQDVQCIQAGTVRIALKTTVNKVSTAHELKLGDSLAASGDRVTLVGVAPERTKDGAPAFSSYRLTFRVERAAAAGMDPGAGTPPGRCYVGGCSSEICSDQPNQPSPCIYRPDFACYKQATCERQANGACGWTQTSSLRACLANPPSAS